MKQFIPAHAALPPATADDALLVKRSRLGVSAEEAFRWHERPGALERMTPPWSPVSVEDRSGGIEVGARVVLRIPAGLNIEATAPILCAGVTTYSPL